MRYLEDIVSRNYKGERLTYSRMLIEAIGLLRDLKFELGNYFEPLDAERAPLYGNDAG